MPAAALPHDCEVLVGVKLPVTAAAVLALPKATPMGYGLGKSGWVSIRFEPSAGPPRDTIQRWVMESYRVKAPKRLLRALEAAQPERTPCVWTSIARRVQALEG